MTMQQPQEPATACRVRSRTRARVISSGLSLIDLLVVMTVTSLVLTAGAVFLSTAFEMNSARQRDLQTEVQLQSLSTRLRDIVASATDIKMPEPGRMIITAHDSQTEITADANTIIMKATGQGLPDRREEFQLTPNFLTELSVTNDTELPLVVLSLTKEEPIGTVPWLRVVAATNRLVYQGGTP